MLAAGILMLVDIKYVHIDVTRTTNDISGLQCFYISWWDEEEEYMKQIGLLKWKRGGQ